jgi:FSR family fosmidomycin resistance protein-like MFS transporter
MFNRVSGKSSRLVLVSIASGLPLALLFLLIEFFDELAFGSIGAALPVIRAELELSYAQIGLLLGIPAFASVLIEPAIMLLGDTGLRKRLIVSGGLVIALALLMMASAGSFPLMLAAFILSYPASGAFVSLSQATLIDLHPGREAHMMARWTLAGSLGVLAGPLLVAGALSLALGWRPVFYTMAGLALVLAFLALLRQFPARSSAAYSPPGDLAQPAAAQPVSPSHQPHASLSLPASALVPERARLATIARNLWELMRNPQVMRWILLLQFSDLLLDVLYGYAPLYLTDVIGVTAAQAGLLLSVLTLAGLASDAALIPLLERLPGRWLVRASAGLSLPVYAAMLLAPWPMVKIGLLVLVSFTTLGWYSVLQGEAYAAARGRSGTMMALGSFAGLLGGGMAWLVGYVAELAGLASAMWLLTLGPLALVLFVPPPGESK